LIISIILPLLGFMMLLSGLQAKQAALYMLGGSLMIIGLCLLARRFRLPDRAAYTLAGIGLLAFWIISFEYMPYEDEMTSGMEMFILSGIFYVAGAVWVIMYNSDLLLAAITFIFGRIKALAPVLKTAVSYPMASRFRTGMAMAMFSLIIFTLVIIAVINASFDRVIGDTDRVSGGFHIISTVNYNNPISDITTALDEPGGVGSDNFQAIAGLSPIPVKAHQTDKEQEWVDIYLTGADIGYIENVNYGFQLTMEAYTSKEEVWAAMAADPSLAVVNAAMVPSKEGGGGPAETTDLTIGEGDFYLEDKFLPDDVYIEVQNYDPDPGKVVTKELHIIGVVDIMAGPLAPPIITSQEIIDALAGETVYPTTYLFQVKPDKIDNVSDLAVSLEKQFSINGMDTAILAEEIKDYSELNSMFFNLITVFMGLGLIVGIAALGVISARSVVERRQQIGVLRALGFQRRMVQFSFLLESSFIALLGIGIGIALGLILSVQLIPDMGIEGIEMAVPWGRIILIVAIAYGASLITTFLPAWQASRVYPAEALRYE
ncbi:ABC transporter permease, partial [Chloroflexota bacterium]